MDRLLKLKDRIVARIFRILSLNFIFPFVYKKAAKKPVDPNKIVFVEIRLPSVSNSNRIIFNEIIGKYDFTVHSHFLLTNSERKNVYLRRCNDMLRDIATAKYVFISDSTNCIGSVKFRPESELIQLWHGCGAFKKFGLSTGNLIFGESMKEQLKHPTNNNDTYITISSPEVKWAYEEAMNPSKKDAVVATGVSRTDVFYDDEFIKSAYDNLYDVVPMAKGKKIILYAPTFRGRVARATTSRMFNLKMFYENLGEDYFILFKHHPLVKKTPAIPNEYSNFAADVTNSMEIDDLLCVSDICITDYSSLVYEYSIFEKPIIFFAFDLDTYFDWRGFYYDYYEMSPGPICTTNLEMINYIKNLDTSFDKQRVKDFKYKFMRSCDGNSTNRILETVIGKDILEKHRKSTCDIQPYSLVPDSNVLYRDYLSEVNYFKKQKILFNNEYKKYIDKEIVPGKAVLLNCSKEIRNPFKKYCSDIIILKTSKSDNNINLNIIKEIADAEYIFIEESNTLLDLINIKDDTKVVYIPKYGLPFRKFGKSTLKYKSGLYKEKYNIAPLNRKIDLVAVSNEVLSEVYTEALGVDKSAFVYCGDVKNDCLFNKKFKKKSLDKLTKLCGDLNGKKILLDFVSRENEKVPNYESDCDNYLYEYLKDDYIIIKYFVDNNGKKLKIDTAYTQTMKSYVNGIFDVTSIFDEYEAIAAADVIIGSFANGLFSSFAVDKPVFAYVPFCRARLHKMQTNFKYEAILPCPAFDDYGKLVNAIINVDKYDFSKIKKFRETFLGDNDGKACERLLMKLGLIK